MLTFGPVISSGCLLLAQQVELNKNPERNEDPQRSDFQNPKSCGNQWKVDMEGRTSDYPQRHTPARKREDWCNFQIPNKVIQQYTVKASKISFSLA